MQKIYLFDDPANYAFDDEAVAIGGGKLKLKIDESEDNYTQAFTSDSGFEYDDSLAEFVAGVLRQIDQRPADALLGISYASSVNASWAVSGSLTGTANSGASVSGGKLDLRGGTGKSVDYDLTNRIGVASGAIRLKWTPNYNGTPTDSVEFFTIEETQGSGKSKIQLLHHSNGSLFLLVNDVDGANVYSNSLLTFSATAGQESVIEVGWDLDNDKFYVFGAGFSLADLDMPMTRGECTFLRVGGSSGDTNSYFDDVITFGANQHTANHDPTYSVPDAAFVESAAELPEMAYAAGDGSFLEVTDFSATEGNNPRYTVQIGRSGTYLYWNGSAWVASNGSYAQATSQSDFDSNVGSLDVDGEVYIQLKVHFQTSNVQQTIDFLQLKILESTVYTTDEQMIIPNGRFEAAELISFLHSAVTPDDTLIRYILEVDSRKLYWNGSNWVGSNGTIGQANTQQQVEDHIVQAIDEVSQVKVIFIIKSNDESASPEINSVTVTYSEFIGGMRGYMNSILAFIGQESLTDEEFDTVEVTDPSDDLAVYNELLEILQDRELESDATDRLKFYFQAKGVEVEEPDNARSNIFVGGGL